MFAWLAELHHTTALDDRDVFSVNSGARTLGVNTPEGVSDDLLNATTGIVISPGNGWSHRGTIVAPVRDQRVFDTKRFFSSIARSE